MPEVASSPYANVAAWLTAAGRALLDLFYPPRCPGCGRVGALFCEACQAQIEALPKPACIRCGHPAATETLCPECRQIPSNLDRIASSAIFDHPLRDAIHDLKYNNNRSIARPLGARMAAYWLEHRLSADLIVPVPLHRGRLAERGYNQAALLARVLGREVGVRVAEDTLERQRATQQQVGLGASDRRQNVAGAFAGRGDVSGRCVVLIDDVCTTGSTLEACATALRASGTAGVWAFTLARARWEPGSDKVASDT